MASKHALETVCGLVCAAFLFMGLTIYHGGVTSNDVPGTYSVHYPFGDGALQLYADGRYEQTLRINGREASVAGRWTWKRFPYRRVSPMPAAMLSGPSASPLR